MPTLQEALSFVSRIIYFNTKRKNTVEIIIVILNWWFFKIKIKKYE